MKSPRLWSMAVASALLVAGCSVVKGPERPTWRVFALEPAPTTSRAAAVDAADGAVVVVAAPRAGAGYSTRRMAYSHGNGELEYFAEHRWADTPARMLAPLLRDALTRTGAFSAVAVTPTRAQADVVVESEILVFRQEMDGESARFRAVLQVTVVRSGESGARTRVFEIEEPLEVVGPAEGVAAANRAVARLLTDAAAFCAESATP